MRTPVFAANNNGVKYAFVGKDANGDEVLATETPLFRIDENTGIITTKVNFEDVQNLQSSYNMKIRAYDPKYNKLYDEASVPIVVMGWGVDRDMEVKEQRFIRWDRNGVLIVVVLLQMII